MLEFQESGMEFSFDEKDTFLIEKNNIYVHKLEAYGVKVVECVNFNSNRKAIRFIEAKSSAPQIKNKDDFKKFLVDIKIKFIHSTMLLDSMLLGKWTDSLDEMLIGSRLSDAYKKNVRQIYMLIVNGYPARDLPILSDIFKNEMRPILKIHHAEMVVLNEEKALERKIITSYIKD